MITLFRKILWILGSFCALLLIIALITLKPISDKSLNEYPEVQHTLQVLDQPQVNSSPGGELSVGWAAVNITPSNPIDMAGYGPRGPYKSVLDSLYARILLFDNQQAKAVIISIDLLMFPPVLKQTLEEQLADQGFPKDLIYLTATHTHHGFGNWEKSLAGEFIFGKYNEKNMNRMIDQILIGLEKAEETKRLATIGFQIIDAGNLVINRLAPETGSKDPFLRVIHLKKDDGQKAMFISFSGHATNLDADNWELSRDYPGILVQRLEANEGIDFAMFGAGMVGSHNIDIDIPKGHQRIEEIGRQLASRIIDNNQNISLDSTAIISGLDTTLGLPASQMRLTKQIVVRDWVFKALFGPLKANIKALSIGNVLLIGMPCDYSGELSINNDLDRYAQNHGKELFITSFNGNYVGYITEDQHYYIQDHDEVKTMNWVGPYMGEYFTQSIEKVIDAIK